jgi:hypothetical protein
MDFHYTLLENGLDFVPSSLEHLTAASATSAPENGSQKRHLKYALIHLGSGIELVFKERLRQEDWQLLFQEQLAMIEPEIGKLQTVVQCPSCLQEAMNADGGTVKCLFCPYSPDPSEAAEEDLTNVLGYTGRFSVEKNGGQWPIQICPESGHDTFVTAVLGRFDAYAFYCFNCGVEYDSIELEVCYDCGEYHNHGGEAGSHICSSCFHPRVSNDNE